uniref:Uncharacterized protein n=1 Tax=Cacopsylla melanoneura TaxID=428564 RepID=A0A8D8Z8A8_9HEMI
MGNKAGVGEAEAGVGVTVNLVPLRVVDGEFPLIRGAPCCCNAFNSVIFLTRLVFLSSLGVVFFGCRMFGARVVDWILASDVVVVACEELRSPLHLAMDVLLV